MAEPQRLSHRFHCRGVNLGASIDELGPGEYPYLLNVRSLQQGGVQNRPGQELLAGYPSLPVHTIRSLNNVATNTTGNFYGAGTGLFLDDAQIYAQGTFSGDPLSMVRFRPDQSTESWMYIADRLLMAKANVEGQVKNVGIAPPQFAPVVEVASSLASPVSYFKSASGWTAGTETDRTQGSVTIGAILYDDTVATNTQFCVLSPVSTASADFSWAQPGMSIHLDNGTNNEDTNVLEVHNPIATSTVQSIQYDSVAPGLCTVVLNTATQGLDHNSMVIIGIEYVRVISANVGPDGLYSFRCFTNIRHIPTETVVGVISFRLYTTFTYIATNPITAFSLQFSAAAPTGGADSATTRISLTEPSTLDLSQISSRPVGPDDYMHISIKMDMPGNLLYGRVLLDIDATTNNFLQNFYQKEFRPSDFESSVDGESSTLLAGLNAINNTQIDQAASDYITGDIYTGPSFGPGTNQTGVPQPNSDQLATGNSQWTELTFNISDLQRVGTDTTRSLQNVQAIGIELVVSGAIVCQVSSWYVAGTYGPDVTPGEPTGILYRYRYRDSSTGAKSIPGPACRYQVYPLRQWVSVVVTPSQDGACDVIDIERLDPTLQGGSGGPEWRYTCSVTNNPGLATIQGNDFNTAEYVTGTTPLEINVIQPFVTLLPPIQTTAMVTGTSVVVNSVLPAKLLQDTVIRLNGVAYQLYATPTPNTPNAGTTFLELVESFGTGTEVLVQIDSPNVYGQPLPYIFGPLEGPTASFVFGLGDPNNPGLLYWLNGNDPDSMDSKNFLEVTPPSEPLISGVVWNTYVFVASRDRLFLIQPTFDQPNLFTAVAVASNSGVQGRWLMAGGADGVYFGGRDSVYKATPFAGGTSCSKELWPLFTHEGQPGSPTNGYQPINFARTDQLRIADGDIYVLTGGVDWRYGLVGADKDMVPSIERGWFPESYPQPPLTVYLQELPDNGQTPKLLQGVAGSVQWVGSTKDNGASINGTITIPPLKPGNDTRANNLYIDCITDLQGSAMLTLLGNLNTVIVQAAQQVNQVVRGLAITNIDQTGNLALYRDVSSMFVLGDGAVLYEWQPRYFPQPVTATNYTQQNTDHGIPGWKLSRYLRMAMICSGQTVLTVTTSEGQTYTYIFQATVGLSGMQTQDQNVNALMKARLYGYDLTGPPFVMFPNSCFIRMKKFGTEGAFQEVPIFAQN